MRDVFEKLETATFGSTHNEDNVSKEGTVVVVVPVDEADNEADEARRQREKATK